VSGEKYQKLGDSQKRFQDATQQQKKAWEHLKCQRDRLLKAVEKLNAEEKQRLDQC
jgi:hypothetical protein